MTYESLLLNDGGGVIPPGHRSNQYAGAATLIIGIGGVGVTALAKLKQKVYQDLIPDHPGDPHPRYDHIQFLAIDSDEDVIASMRGEARIDPVSEFFSLSDPCLRDALRYRDTIRNHPLFHWMDIDHLPPVLGPVGTGAMRQVGRFFLISKAAALKAKIEEKCTAALRGLNTPSLNIYILAGLSGGTGSGCFLDTCYIVRKALEEIGWAASGRIIGLFFLPDVILSKLGAAGDPASVNRNRANGYAALKELDYHMDLRAACDSFRQNYGAFSIDSQDPPVDLCYLISATRADGTAFPNGFYNAIHTAADYVMSDLTDYMNAGFTLPAYLAGTVHGVSRLSHRHGSNCSYHLFGIANAEVPTTQIATYLAVSYYHRFQARIGRDKTVITQNAVNDLMKELGLTAEQVFHALCKGCESLTLPDVDYKMLLQFGILPRGRAPQCWVTPGDTWLDKCSGKREENRAVLTAELSTFDFHAASADSLIGRVFRTLCELSMDPEYGPYYAAGLLHHTGYDMMSALNDAIKQTEAQLETQKFHFNSENGPLNALQQCSEDFVHSIFFSRRRNYESYRESAASFYKAVDRLSALECTLNTLYALRASLNRLYNDYFRPLLQLLDNLQETFAEDIHYLNSPAAAPAACTRRILDLSEIKPRLDEVIDRLDENALVSRFMAHILNGFDQWQSGDDGKISQYISLYMELTFHDEFNRSLQDYLFDVYLPAGGNPALLAQEVERDIIHHLHQNAFPMFLCDPAFDLSDPTAIYHQCEILVPYNAPAAQSAAVSFQRSYHEYVVHQTRCDNRISIIRCFSGVPLHACGFLPMWKNAYDAMGEAYIHLYANTGRGDDSRDWYTFLPDPVPASCAPQLSPSQEELLDLYRQGEETGIIGKDVSDSLVLYQTPALGLPDCGPEDFWKDHVFQFVPFDAARKELNHQLEDFCNHILAQKWLPLKDDGDRRLGDAVVAQVRRDHFLRFPVLQQILREELEKLHTLQEALQRLDAIGEDLSRYGPDLNDFYDMLFYGILDCTDSMGQPAYNAKTSRILFHFIDDRGLPAYHLLARDGDPELPYSRSFPLYQAFLSYHALPETSPIRQEMASLLQQRRAAPLRSETTPILSQLKEVWNSQSLQSLEHLLFDLPTPQEREDIRYFYTQLVDHIQKFISPC